MKFADNPFYTTDFNNGNVNLKGYSKVTSSQTKDDFTITTPRKSEIFNTFGAGIRTNVISSLPERSAFLPPAPFTSQAGAQPTLKSHQLPPQPVPSRQPLLHPQHSSGTTAPLHIQHSSGTQLQQQHPDVSKVMPRILQLELSTLTSDIDRLEKKISALQVYATSLGTPNETTNNTLREYSKDAKKLTDHASRLFDRFDEKIDIRTRNIMENVFTNASDLSESLSSIHHICSTDLLTPQVSASLLRNVKIPRLNVSTWVSPGFYCQARDLLNHIATNRFQDRYYVDQVLQDLETE